MRLPDPQQRGFALPLALTTSALLLLSSLSLQTLALHARQRLAPRCRALGGGGVSTALHRRPRLLVGLALLGVG